MSKPAPQYRVLDAIDLLANWGEGSSVTAEFTLEEIDTLPEDIKLQILKRLLEEMGHKISS